mgnify:CR=1 FL=1
MYSTYLHFHLLYCFSFRVIPVVWFGLADNNRVDEKKSEITHTIKYDAFLFLLLNPARAASVHVRRWPAINYFSLAQSDVRRLWGAFSRPRTFLVMFYSHVETVTHPICTSRIPSGPITTLLVGFHWGSLLCLLVPTMNEKWLQV